MKKKKTSKKVSRTSARKSTARKSTAKKATAAGKKKKTTKKAGAAKKRTSKKKKVTKVGKKKKVTRKAASRGKPSKKKSQKKPATKKKTGTTRKKSGSKKKTSSKKKVAKSAAKSSAGGDAGSDGSPKKSSKKIDPRKRGRSVAEVASGTAADEQGYVFINGRRVRMISTAGKVLPKKSRAVAADEAAQEKPAKLGKTKLTKKQLDHYRALLLIKRAELVGDLTSMEAAALRSSGGEISHMPIHMADIGSDTYDQDFNLGLAEADRKHLREIDDALACIVDRTYGVCQMTGKPIPKARLEAKPWAKYTIEAARIIESQS